jgi:hypothetical protein
LYQRVGGAWTLVSTLEPSDATGGDRFGIALSASEDTVAVGAPSDKTRGLLSGAVYVYARSPAGEWQREAYLKASDASASATFGEQVALAGDTLVVGAPGANDAAKLYVFERVAGSWVDRGQLRPSGAVPADLAGISLAFDGQTLVVGAPSDDGQDDDSYGTGAAYVYERSDDGEWLQAHVLRASNAPARPPPPECHSLTCIPPAFVEGFGRQVAMGGGTLAVGAPGASTRPNGDGSFFAGPGAIYVYEKSAGKWSERAILAPPPSVGGSRFGSSVAVDGEKLLVGAPADGRHHLRTDADFLGYSFRRDTSDWTFAKVLHTSDRHLTGLLDQSVAVWGGTAAIGAPTQSNLAGAVYVTDEP